MFAFSTHVSDHRNGLYNDDGRQTGRCNIWYSHITQSILSVPNVAFQLYIICCIRQIFEAIKRKTVKYLPSTLVEQSLHLDYVCTTSDNNFYTEQPLTLGTLVYLDTGKF